MPALTGGQAASVQPETRYAKGEDGYGQMAMLFAATYPERTSALIVVDSGARGLRDVDYPWAPSRRQGAAVPRARVRGAIGARKLPREADEPHRPSRLPQLSDNLSP